MLDQRVEVVLDEELFAGLQARVQRGESNSVENLIRADLRTVQLAGSTDEADLADACVAYDEMESGADPGIAIEDIMTRFGIQVPASSRKAA